MAQYYQVTSLEELHKLYPNLQLDNLEGIQCSVQDDQVTQYTEGQGQQVITTVERSGMQLSHNTSSSQQCTSHPSQLVVHQGTQYVIQQLDASDSQISTVQYLQQRQPEIQTKEEIPLVQYEDQNVRCSSADMGSKEGPVQQCLLKQENNQQYLPQVQPMLQQPMQIHQQIQAVDMGTNILVLQNQEQQDLLKQNQNQELISDSHETQQQQQPQLQPQQIVIQRQHQQKPQQLIAQKQVFLKKENSQDCSPSQILQSRHLSQTVGQQQQVIHSSQPQIIQPLQYFNQVTVIDNFSPSRVSLEQQLPNNDNMLPQQGQTQVQQFRPKKNLQQTNLSTLNQQPQVVVPQTFELSSSPSIGGTMTQAKKKVLAQDIERPNAPVFIVQKMDTPFLIRSHQTKIRFQSPQPSSEKSSDSPYQSVSTQSEQQIAESITPENRRLTTSPSVSVEQTEAQEKLSVTGQISDPQLNKNSEKNVSFSPLKAGIMDEPFESKSGEQISKHKVCTQIPSRSSFAKSKPVEQQTESLAVGNGKEVGTQPFQRFISNSEAQLRPLSAISSTHSSVDIQNQTQVANRGRGIRVPSPRGCQFLSRPRGVQVQTLASTPRLPLMEKGGICRKLKPPRACKIECVTSGPEQRQLTFVRPAIQQVSPISGSKSETNQGGNETVEEARMVVLLINGEKKIVKIPCSQNILLGQILQQAGLSLTSPTPITIEQVVDNTTDQSMKNNSQNSQQLSIGFKSLNASQVVSVQNSLGPPRSIITSIQQRPRGQSFHTTQTSNIGIIKHRIQFSNPRLSSPNYSGSTTITANTMSETITSLSQGAQSSMPQSMPVKDEPRFVSGFMAICPFCGISSLDFNKCIRCRRKLPENVKSQSICSVKKKKEKATGLGEKTDECKSETEEKSVDFSESEEKDRVSALQGYDRRKLKPCLKKKKISDEPTEILILSSDEEEDGKFKKVLSNEPVLSVLKKEPVYTDSLNESEMTNSLKEGNLNEDSVKNMPPGVFTTLQCRTVKIGSYKVQPKERVLVSTSGIRMVINSLKNESTSVIISAADILKVLIHVGKQIPVMFIYPLPKIGFQIRELLGMDNKMGPYYDPTSTQEETHKRITLLLEKITDDNKMAINKIFGPDKLEELSEKEANEILIRASPMEMQGAGICRLTDGVRKILVYPPPPEKGGITLNNQDYACLGEDQFLNDVIIDFYLKYLLLKVLSPADRNRTHVFSTFFYKRLTTKPKTLRKNDPENDPKLSPAEKRHMRVKGWTKQVNLFEKDFIIVPINEHSHWFLAIICFPGLTGPVRFSDNAPVEPEEIFPKKNSSSIQIGSTTITHIIKTSGNTISLEMDSGSDRDEAEGDQDDLHPSSDDEGGEQAEEESNNASSVQIPLLTSASQTQVSAKDSKPKTVKKKSFKEPIKQPCILIFDSLAGASRVRVVATLRDYLKIEYKKKMGQERDFSKDTIKGAVPKVPQQNNFTDCGLYVLQYVESFFQDPLYDFKLPLKYLQDWFPEEVVSSKRQKLAFLIRSLMEEQGIKVEEMGLPVLTFTSGSNAGDDQTRMDDDEVDDEDELNEEDEEDEEEEEEEELLRSKIQISGFNEDEEEMNLEEEDEIDDEEEEEDDEDDEELDEELDEEYEDEELEVGEIPRHWLTRTSGSSGKLEPSIKRNKPVVFKTTALVEYDPSDSDEEGQSFRRNSIVIKESQTTASTGVSEQGEYCSSNEAILSENRKTVPLTEFQDFESQISCTTIERNVDCKNNKSEVLMSQEEVVDDQCKSEEEKNTSKSSESVERNVTDSFNQSVEKKIYRPNEVTDIIKKLVNDRNITISRKDHELNSNIFRKHLDVKKLQVKDCDKDEAVDKASSPGSTPNVNLGTYKRPYQTLKSVRIPKKTERNLDLCSKRQKIDER